MSEETQSKTQWVEPDFRPKAILWDEQAFWADETVRFMTPTQRGMYTRLLMSCYFGAFRPYVPNDDSKLWRMADAESLAHWQTNREPILSKFAEETVNGVAVLSNGRCLEEWSRQEAWLEKSKMGGKKSAAMRRRTGTNPPAPPEKKETEKKGTTSSSLIKSGSPGGSTTLEPPLNHPSKEGEVGDRSVPPSFSTGNQPIPSVMSEILKAAERILHGTKIETGPKDPARAKHLETILGRELLLKTWETWLCDDSNLRFSEDEYRDYPFSHFADSGQCEVLAEKIVPILEAGFKNPETINQVYQYGIEAGSDLSAEEITILEAEPELADRYASFCNQNRGGTLKDLVQILKSPNTKAVA
jgi:uncharacterized protein YdaU (DUF1376 family)